MSSSPALPPGPGAGRLAQGTRFHRDPLGFLQRCRADHGEVFTLRLAVAGPMVAFTSPDAFEELLVSDPERAHTGEGRRRILGMVSPRSVLGADGDRHRAARGHVIEAFGAGPMERRREEMASIAAEHARRWRRGRPFRLLPRMRAIADEIFAREIVGIRSDGRARALAASVQGMLRTPGNPPLPPPGEGAGLAGELGKLLFERRRRPASELLAAEIADRRHAGADTGDDVISCMLRSDPDQRVEEAVDELLPLLMAGQEPPAAGLTWLLDRLARERGLADEFVELPDRSPRRDAIVRETLRLRPAVHSVVRRLTGPATIAGHPLPAGAVAMGPIVLVHRDPSAYPDHAAFRPERFLASDAPALPHHPFGGGARRCLGELLAHAQIASVVPTILRQLRLRPLASRPERMVVRGTVLVPHRSGMVVATDRREG